MPRVKGQNSGIKRAANQSAPAGLPEGGDPSAPESFINTADPLVDSSLPFEDQNPTAQVNGLNIAGTAASSKNLNEKAAITHSQGRPSSQLPEVKRSSSMLEGDAGAKIRGKGKGKFGKILRETDTKEYELIPS